ncbi:MAG: hypothetical protein MK194_02180 [Roseibacillus sp.]|nr:hypothetical protein [Roseibacillus sp.]
MPITLKCAACGAEVEFEELSPMVEETCPGCLVKVRYRECDEQMAIPVSMSLPEEFAHVDLSSVADKSSLLVGRYKKTTEESEDENSVELVLARALESLAHSIGHLDERLTRHEQGGATVPDEKEEERSEVAVEEGTASDPVPEKDGSQTNGVKVVMGKGNGEDEDGKIVHLEPEEKEKFCGNGKANPVDARVLVRREAARAAHEFRREKHTQGDWDERAAPADRTGFSWLMSNYPKTTVAVSTVLVGALIMGTILWMEGLTAGRRANEELNLPAPQGTDLSRLMADDPAAATAETVVRGYLNATSAKAARPFVWESEAIKDKFERYFQPLSQPGSYELSLRQRVIGKDGKAQFFYRVGLPGEKARSLLVLPEGAMPKVFWEFFEEIGDMSWHEFFSERPTSPVEMRVWLYPVEQYVSGYDDKKKWQSYMLHDYAEKHKVLAYASRGLGDDWQISDALRNEPVSFNRHEAVMALLKLTYVKEFKTGEESGAVAEINDVLATSWLPERFRVEREK